MLPSTAKTVAWMLLMTVGASLSAAAQAMPASGHWTPRSAPIDLGVNYVADISNAPPGTCGCFLMQGGGATVRFGLPYRLSAVADLSVVNTNNVPNTGFGLGLTTILGGAQYRLPNGRYTNYGQVLLGAVRGFDSVFPANSSNSPSAFAYALGAGSEVKINRRFAARLIELDYLRTGLPNNSTNWQNHLKIASGLIVHF